MQHLHILMQALFRETQRRERDTQTGDHHAKTVKDRHADTAQPFFLLFVILAITLLTHLFQHGDQLIGVGNRALGAALILNAFEDLANFSGITPGQQNLTNSRTVQRVTTPYAGVHTQVIHGVNFMDVDNAVFIKRTQVNGLFRQTREFTHLYVRAADQIDVLQRPSAQLKKLQGQRILFRFPFLGNITQRLHGLQKAINGAFRHHDALRKFSNANFAFFAKRLQDTKYL